MLGLNGPRVATAICAAVVMLAMPVGAIGDPKDPNVGLPSSADPFESTDKTGSANNAESTDAARPAYRGRSAGKAEPSRQLRHRYGARRYASSCGARYSDSSCSPRRYRSRCVGNYASSCGYDGGNCCASSCGDYASGCDDYAYAPAPYYSADWVAAPVEAPYNGVVLGDVLTYDAGWDLGVVPAAPAAELIAVPIVAAPGPWGW